MNTQQLLLSTLLTATIFAGCKKDDDDGTGVDVVPAAPAVNALLAVFSEHVEDAKQEFTVNASTGGSIQGNDGVAIYFPPNAFRTASGFMVTGTVQVELVEALTVGDMVWLNKQTLGNDDGQMRPLVSGGQYFLSVSQGGQQLQLAENAGYVTVPAPNGVDPSMALFSGTLEEDGTITWDPFGEIGANGALDSSGYSFPNDSLGWVNCDYFMGGGAQTAVQVTCPAGHTGANTIVWLVFPDQNSMTGISGGESNVFSTGSYYSLPVGLNVTIVAVSNAGGSYSSSITSTVVTAGMDQTITFSPTTLAEFEAAVQGL